MQDSGRHTEQIEHIHAIMARSTTFVSLSGLAGLTAGLFAIAATWLLYHLLGTLWLSDQVFATLRDSPAVVRSVAGVFLWTLIAALAVAFLLTWRRARAYQHELWNLASRRFAAHLVLPLLAGGVLVVALLQFGTYELICPSMLLFFGLALISAGKYSFSETVIFGVVELALGCIGAFWTSAGLVLWAVGFGLVTAAYGIIMYLNHER